jgi:hypothetical protein
VAKQKASFDKVVFTERVKHGLLDFHPGPVYEFEDPDAAPYFKACGWAEDSTAEAQVRITFDELDIDPCVVWGAPLDPANKFKFVMPERAAEARGISLEEAKAYVWDGQEVLRNG